METQQHEGGEIIKYAHNQEGMRSLSDPGDKCWVNWRYKEKDDGKQTKIPYTPNGKNAKTTDPLTWSTFDDVLVARDHFDGIGIVFTGLLLGIDIDHCIVDGNISSEIASFIQEAKTYTEVSPSKAGLHLYIGLTEPMVLDRNRSGSVECYTSGRYFTVTGDLWYSSYPLRTVTPTEALDLLNLLGYPWGEKSHKPIDASSVPMQIAGDEAVLKKMFASKNGVAIKALYNGDISKFGDDDSAADASLCAHLAFWTDGNESQIESLWLASPLGTRSKTQERKDYRERTIAFAMQENHTNQEEGSSPLEEENFKKDFNGNPKKISYEIAKFLIKKHHVKTIGEKIRDIYIYNNGIYELGVNSLKTEIQEILEELATTSHKNNIIETIKDLTTAKLNEFNVDKNLVNLKNGIYDIKNKVIMPHDPKHLFFTKIPVDYDANAKCPIIERFLTGILPKDYKKVVFEWFGYCLYRQYFIKKAIIFVGEKDTGKSTLIKLFERFIGGENTSGISLQRLVSDKFASSSLHNKHINVYDDLSFDDINDNGFFKIATGGGIITGEKKFGEQFQFVNYSKLTFACNKIPDVKDTNDPAYFSRWIIIPFLIQIEMVDKFLTDKITTREELSGLLNLALSGLSEIINKQNFSYDKTPEEIKKEMLLSGSMVANFVENRLEEQPGAWISKDEMYEECARYAQANSLPTISKVMLGRKLSNHSGYIIDGKRTIDGKQVPGWLNVTIKGVKKEGKEGIFQEVSGQF